MDTTALLIVTLTVVVPVVAMAWVRRWMMSQKAPGAAAAADDETS